MYRRCWGLGGRSWLRVNEIFGGVLLFWSCFGAGMAFCRLDDIPGGEMADVP